jgi:hypothetical protein
LFNFTRLHFNFGIGNTVLETPEISGRQEIADLKVIILNLGWQIFSKQIEKTKRKFNLLAANMCIYKQQLIAINANSKQNN